MTDDENIDESKRKLEEEFEKDLEKPTPSKEEPGEPTPSKEEPEKPTNTFELIEAKTTQLIEDPTLNENQKKELLSIQELLLSVSKQTSSVEAISEYDPEYNAYNLARSAAILALEHSWSKIKPKLDFLREQVENSPLGVTRTNTLSNVFAKFERKCINEIIHSKKPNNKNDNKTFEAETFDQIVTLLPKIYADFFYAIIGGVTFNYGGKDWLKTKKNTEKFRAFVLDLRDKKKKDVVAKTPHTPDYKSCDMQNGDALSKKYERGFLYQGYWQVEFMITELRNHTEHWVKEENKPFLRDELDRMIEDPISGIESPGNFFILISILLLMSYHFIDVMQTWLDTVKLVEK